MTPKTCCYDQASWNCSCPTDILTAIPSVSNSCQSTNLKQTICPSQTRKPDWESRGDNPPHSPGDSLAGSVPPN